MKNKYGQKKLSMRPKLEKRIEIPTHYGKPIRHRRQLQLKVNDKMYADLLIALERDGIDDLSAYFKSLIILYVENEPEFRPIIRKVKELMYAENSKYVSDRNEHKLDEAVSEQQRVKRKFGLSKDDVEDIFDILEKDLPKI